MSKKGVEYLMLFVAGLIISSIIALVVYNTSEKVFGLFSWSKDDETSFNELINAVNSDGGEQIIYYVSGKHFLVGFDKNGDEARVRSSMAVKKPVTECNDETCICKCGLDDGEISYYSCMKDAKCRQFEDANSIKGITLLGDEIGDAREGNLMIKGKVEVPLTVKREGSSIIFSIPKQK